MDEGLRLLLSMSLSGAALAGLTALVLVPLRGRAPRAFAYYLWLLVLLRFLCPVGADRSLSHQAVARSETFWVVTGGAEQGADGADIYQGENLVGQDTPMDRTVSTPAVLTALWAGGALLVLGTRLWSGRRLRRELEEGAAPVQPWEQELYRALGGRRVDLPELLRTEGTQSPMLVGVLRPRIYLPFEGMPGSLLGHALRHELVHWRRKDLWYKHLLTLAAAIHWFNPAIWLLARVVDRDCELSCDEAAVRGLGPGERTGYGRTLLWAAQRQMAPANGMSASLWSQKQVLKERLCAIMKPNRMSKLTAALLAAAVLSLSAVSAALGAYAGAEEPTQAPPALEPAKPAADVLPDRQEEAGEVQLAWPFENTDEIVLSALHGRRVHPILGTESSHVGIDVVLEQGTQVLASASGTVLTAGFDKSAGNYIEIDHGTMSTRCAHLDELLVEEGERVEEGQVIGTVGNTGMSTGPHLEFAVYAIGSQSEFFDYTGWLPYDYRCDPLDYLPHSEAFMGGHGEKIPLRY